MEICRVNIIHLLKISFGVFISLFLLILIVSRGHPISYFDTRCLDYRQKDFSRRLNDRIVDYSAEAKRYGINPSLTDRELRKNISGGKLVDVSYSVLYQRIKPMDL